MPTHQIKEQIKVQIKDRIIVALDVPELELAIALIEKLPEVTFWKVGLELFTSAGTEVIRYLKSCGKKVFLDLKLHDIPNTVAATCRVLAKYEVDFLTVHAAGGRAMMQAAQAAIANESTQILAVTVLTSISPPELAADLRISLPLPDYVLELAAMAQDCGISGVVCSAHELTNLRARLGENFYLVTPGIRLAHDTNDDQSRVMTPDQAFALGANYLVIGRAITAATDPVKIWQQITQEN